MSSFSVRPANTWCGLSMAPNALSFARSVIRRSTSAPLRSGFPGSPLMPPHFKVDAIRLEEGRGGGQRRLRPLGAPQAEVIAQGLAFVVEPGEAALLQFGDDEIDEILEALVEVGRHDVEPVGRA